MLEKMNLEVCPTADVLIELAQREAGYEDLGDPARDAGLYAYVESLRNETWQTMTAQARAVAVDYLVHNLATRLYLIADRKKHAQIAQQQIKAPLIVVGPPRSGSTLLHTLLSLDPDNMAPEHWSCREPSPPLALGAPSPERMSAADARMHKLFGLIPDIFVTHPYMIEEGSGALAEDGSDIMSIVGSSQQLWCFWGGESYKRYLLDADHTATVEFHHDFLQHMQYGQDGKRWALKGSDHMLRLAELSRQYPDAKLIWTHRDLGQQLGSLASVQSILLGLRGTPVTPEQRRAQGRRAIELQRASVEKAMQAREAIGEDQFIDVSYHDVLASPIASVERIYDASGLTVSGAHADRMREWLDSHNQTKHGVHKHSPDEFGMDREAINDQFAPYVERFGFGFGIRPELVA